jgi:hypothetical protein
MVDPESQTSFPWKIGYDRTDFVRSIQTKFLINVNIDMHILCIEHKYFGQVSLLFNEG